MSQPYPEPLREPDAPRTATSVLEREETQEQVAEPGDHERFAHYVRKEKILESALSGEPVVALCGKVWVPDETPTSSRSARSARRSTRVCARPRATTTRSDRPG